MTDFLLELRSEEIPARMQAKAREDLRFAFETEIRVEGSFYQGEITTYATPRRLVLIARGLAESTEAETEEFKGPKVGAPDAAIDGFLKKVIATRADLFERDDAKGTATYYVQRQKPSRSTMDVLATIIPRIVRAFPWPKSMRWGAASASTESIRWVRPLHGVVALFGEDIVDCEIAGVKSGAATLGHRFHHPRQITIGSAADYVEKLRACHVLVDQRERETLIRDRATALAAEAGLELIEDEGLVAENAGLTEWPMPLLGRFDAAFLDVPPEVIQLTARVNQKYFVCHDAAGKLANAFVCTANIDASDGGATIVEGNRKVLAARLSDARFFYETDLKVPLEEQAKKLDRIVFHEKLGTVADKVDRVAKLARWLVEEGIVSSPSPLRGEGRGEGQSQAPSLADGPSPDLASLGHPLPEGERENLATLAERAARLAKADLVTGMVGEFPELQGVIGGYYAAAQGEHPAVAAAIRDHYKPVGQGDAVPTDPVTVAVSLADKLDTLAMFFAVGLPPTGSKDPFALRRASLSSIAQIDCSQLRFSLGDAVKAVAVAVQIGFWAEFDRVFPQLNIEFERSIAIGPEVLDLQLRRLTSPDEILGSRDQPKNEYRVGGYEALGTRQISFNSYEAATGYIPAILDFFADRLKVQQREAGVRHDLIDAVFALGGEDDLVRLLARVHALQSFIGTEDGTNLLAGYKRAANILKKEGFPSPLRGASGEDSPRLSSDRAGRDRADAGGRAEGEVGRGAVPERADTAPLPSAASGGSLPLPGGQREQEPLSYTPEKDEAALIAAIDAAEPAAARAVASEDFAAAMAALATLRAPIDAFFETVTVNDADAGKRAARLALLARVRAAVHSVADFSKVEG